MNLKIFGSTAIAASFLTACASNQQASQGTGITPQSLRAGIFSPAKPAFRGCYGTFGVEATPCPVRLKKKNGGSVTVSVNGPGVVFAAVIASDCVGPGSICNVSQTGYTQFAISSVPGQNRCGVAYVVFEGVTASGSPVGTATVKVVNKYC